MTDGRLPRESNPIPGEEPGFTPSHKITGTDEFGDTEGSDGALHVKELGISAYENADIEVGTSAVEVTAGLPNRRTVELFVNGDEPIYIGDSSVTTENGLPIMPGTSKKILIKYGSSISIYAIASSANQSLRVFETK